jgi:hypothetical protein
MEEMSISSESWDDLNAKLRKSLEYSTTIDRLEFHLGQVRVGIGDLEVCSNLKIEAWQGDVLLFDVDADYRKRSSRAFQICEIVGKTVSSCTCCDAGVRISMSDDCILIFRRDGSMESGTITSEVVGFDMF